VMAVITSLMMEEMKTEIRHWYGGGTKESRKNPFNTIPKNAMINVHISMNMPGDFKRSTTVRPPTRASFNCVWFSRILGHVRNPSLFIILDIH
jgi:hypothetical protein